MRSFNPVKRRLSAQACPAQSPRLTNPTTRPALGTLRTLLLMTQSQLSEALRLRAKSPSLTSFAIEGKFRKTDGTTPRREGNLSFALRSEEFGTVSIFARSHKTLSGFPQLPPCASRLATRRPAKVVSTLFRVTGRTIGGVAVGMWMDGLRWGARLA